MRLSRNSISSLLIISGEVKCLKAELEAAKSKVEQEKEEKAQQLSQIEQKYQETLSHCNTVHKEEMDILSQKLASIYTVTLSLVLFLTGLLYLTLLYYTLFIQPFFSFLQMLCFTSTYVFSFWSILFLVII